MTLKKNDVFICTKTIKIYRCEMGELYKIDEIKRFTNSFTRVYLKRNDDPTRIILPYFSEPTKHFKHFYKIGESNDID